MQHIIDIYAMHRRYLCITILLSLPDAGYGQRSFAKCINGLYHNFVFCIFAQSPDDESWAATIELQFIHIDKAIIEDLECLQYVDIKA